MSPPVQPATHRVRGENRRIIAALTQRIPQIEAPSEPPEPRETAREGLIEPKLHSQNLPKGRRSEPRPRGGGGCLGSSLQPEASRFGYLTALCSNIGPCHFPGAWMLVQKGPRGR
jgi:hypothetical protein